MTASLPVLVGCPHVRCAVIGRRWVSWRALPVPIPFNIGLPATSRRNRDGRRKGRCRRHDDRRSRAAALVSGSLATQLGSRDVQLDGWVGSRHHHVGLRRAPLPTRKIRHSVGREVSIGFADISETGATSSCPRSRFPNRFAATPCVVRLWSGMSASPCQRRSAFTVLSA